MSLGSRLTFLAWRLYRTNAGARRVLTPRLRRSAVKGLERHDEFCSAAEPSELWSAPRASDEPALRVLFRGEGPGGARSLAHRRLLATLNHWGARYRHVSGPAAPGRLPFLRGDAPALVLEATRDAGASPEAARSVSFLSLDDLASAPAGVTPLARLREAGHPIAARAQEGVDPPPLAALVSEKGAARQVILPPETLAPSFLASPWGSLVPDAVDWVLGASDWRDPLPALVSARVDDVTGADGLRWLRPFEELGMHPSIGTLHDAWLRSGAEPVAALVAASKRGCSVSPHAFDMDRFVWFDAPRGAPFSPAIMDEHRSQLARDAVETGLAWGRTLNAHFDVIGTSALAVAETLGFRYALGEHVLDQDWRAPPRCRDPLGSPLYAYGPLDPGGKLFGFQASGAIASSAAPRSRYDWLRNFVELDARTGRPIPESLDRAGAVRQGVSQLLSALHAGFPGYLLAHEMHLVALGPEVLGELLEAVLRDVRTRVPHARPSAFDELPAACAVRWRTVLARS